MKFFIKTYHFHQRGNKEESVCLCECERGKLEHHKLLKVRIGKNERTQCDFLIFLLVCIEQSKRTVGKISN
jgi:hypothetical protein